MEQQHGGEWVAFPEITTYVTELAHSNGVACKIFNESKPNVWVFSPTEIAITRGLLNECQSEQDLIQLFKQTKENGHITRSSDDPFEKHIAPLRQCYNAYKKYDEACAALAAGDAERALNLAEEAEELIPEDPLILGLIGRAKEQCGNTTGALIEIKKALRLNDHYYDFYLQRALILHKLNVPDAARRDAEQSVALLPTDQGHYILGLLDLKEEHYENAPTKSTRIIRKSDYFSSP